MPYIWVVRQPRWRAPDEDRLTNPPNAVGLCVREVRCKDQCEIPKRFPACLHRLAPPKANHSSNRSLCSLPSLASA